MAEAPLGMLAGTTMIALTIGVAGCVNPSARISSSLVRFGLNQRQAGFVGDPRP